MKRYKMTIQPLSPIHIGTGEDIPPFEYLLSREESIFHRLDLAGFLAHLKPQQRSEFDKAVNSADIISIRKFVHENIDIKQHTLFMAAVNPDFARAYRAGIENPRNQLQVNLAARCPGTYKAYLPGSSIKGAIRTALIAKIAQLKKVDSVPPKKERYFENDLFGIRDAKQDPFRCLKISDAYLPSDSTYIDSAVIYKPGRKANEADPRGIQMFYEQVFSLADQEEIFAEGTLDINDELPGKKYFDRNAKREISAVPMKISIEQLISSCREFYLYNLKTEYHRFYQQKQSNEYLMNMEYKDNEFPIRLGRFSHIENVTMPFRRPVGRAARAYGTTRTLGGGEFAMGWAKVSLTLLK